MSLPQAPPGSFGVKSCVSHFKLQKKSGFCSTWDFRLAPAFIFPLPPPEVVPLEKLCRRRMLMLILILILILILFQLQGIDGVGRAGSWQTPREGGEESMAASFVNHQK